MNPLARREILMAGLALPFAALGAASPPPQDPLWFVDPELKAAARELLAMQQSSPPMSVGSLPAMRSAPRPWVHAPLPDVPFLKKTLPGKPDVTLYVINAKAGQRRGGILHTHGGGFIMGSAADSIFPLQGLAMELDCAIVTVEYRLAPESTYAASIEDNYAGLEWMHQHADELGVDAARICVMGESAGGGHAALLAITARDRGAIPVAFQCLIYPMLDDRTGSTRQVPPSIGTILWTAEANRFGWHSFLGEAPGSAAVPVKAVPARLDNLKGLPPAFIGVGAIDLFVQEDIAYAQRLLEAAVPTELVVMPGAFHGFDVLGAATRVGKSFNATKLDALRRVLATAG